MSGREHDATMLLSALSEGDHEAGNKLFTILYKELHALSHRTMRKENVGHILQTTALINEAYLKLVKDRNTRWRNRSHFFAVAARAMRRILVSEARMRRAAKRGGNKFPFSLDKISELQDHQPGSQVSAEELEFLDRALDRLAECKSGGRMLTVVELRFFAGLTHDQTGEVLGVSTGTVRRDWDFAKVWLYREMQKANSDDG